MKKTKTEKIKYPENREVNRQLRTGERRLIQEKTGLIYTYIYQVLQGWRHNDEVIKVSKQISQNRKDLIDS